MYPGEDRKLLEFKAAAPVDVERYRKKVLRCNACGMEQMHNKQVIKWTNSARSSIALQKIYGMPFYRLSEMQTMYGVPIASSTLWYQVEGLWNDCAKDIVQQLFFLAGESDKLYSDDTTARILEVISEKKQSNKKIRSCHTTTIRAETVDGPIVLFVSDQKYCGENLDGILSGRINTKPVKLMTDASNQNNPSVEGVDIIHSKCLAHGRRKFYDIKDYYPNECNYFLEQIALIYGNETKAKRLGAAERLAYHKANSAEPINNIYNMIAHLFDTKAVEPNSALGKAMQYWLNHKDGLTKFLEVADVAIDNNTSEQALKKIILQRKNSLFFKTKDSAKILNGMSSIVSTCQEQGINAFAYLNMIQEKANEVRKDPGKFLPWMLSQAPPIAA